MNKPSTELLNHLFDSYFPHERFTFSSWVKGSGPLKKPYFEFNNFDGILVLKFEKNGYRLWYNISAMNIYTAGPRWRDLVARGIRQIRREFKQRGY